MEQIVSLKNSIILLLFFILIILLNSCNKCLSCSIYFDEGIYYNPVSKDSIIIKAKSNNYGLDTLEKYYLLGYKFTGSGTSDIFDIELCGDDLKRLDDKGFNVNCNYNK
jgi:hypothetical protein